MTDKHTGSIVVVRPLQHCERCGVVYPEGRAHVCVRPEHQHQDRSVYAELLQAGCELDSHESDLYVLDSPEARVILGRYPFVCWSPFFSSLDGRRWLDLPFCYQPWWQSRGLR